MTTEKCFICSSGILYLHLVLEAFTVVMGLVYGVFVGPPKVRLGKSSYVGALFVEFDSNRGRFSFLRS